MKETQRAISSWVGIGGLFFFIATQSFPFVFFDLTPRVARFGDSFQHLPRQFFFARPDSEVT